MNEDESRWNLFPKAPRKPTTDQLQREFLNALSNAKVAGTYFPLEQGIQRLGQHLQQIVEASRLHLVLLVGGFAVGKSHLSRVIHQGLFPFHQAITLCDRDSNSVAFLRALAEKSASFEHTLAILAHFDSAKIIRNISSITRNEYTVVSVIADQRTRHSNAVRRHFQSENVSIEEAFTHGGVRHVHQQPNCIDDPDIVLDNSEMHQVADEKLVKVLAESYSSRQT